MKKILLILLVSCSLQAQETLHKNRLTVGLINQIEVAPRYNLGYFRDITEKISVGVTFGYGNYNIMYVQPAENTENYKLFEIRPEIMFFHRTTKKSPHYVSAEFFYINHTDRFSKSYYYKNNRDVFFDQANYQRTKMGLNINYGIVVSFNKNKRFGMIPEMGLGYKIRNVKFSNIINEKVSESESEGCFPYSSENMYHELGTIKNIHFNFNWRLYYKF